MIQLKVQPTPEQSDALRRTLVRANEACDYITHLTQYACTQRTLIRQILHLWGSL